MESGFDVFQNSVYKNKRNRKRTLIVDVSDSNADNHLGGGTEFKIDLFEPLVIDKHSEVYLDNFLLGLETSFQEKYWKRYCY